MRIGECVRSMNRRHVLADQAQVDAADQLRPLGFGGMQSDGGLLPGGRVRAEQHKAAEPGAQRRDKGAGAERNDPQQQQREPGHAGGDNDLGEQGYLAAALERDGQRLDARLEPVDVIAEFAHGI